MTSSKLTCRASLLAGAALFAVSSLAAMPASAAPENTDWLSYNNDLLSQRYSPLKQINAKNVASLKEVCRIKVQDGGSFHTGPLTSLSTTTYGR